MSDTQTQQTKQNDTSPFGEPTVSIPPSEEQIDETFELIQDRLEDPRMSSPINIQVKRGYEAALDILEFTKNESDINLIQGVQASAIASLAVDYLKGDCSQKVLLGVPLKSVSIKPTIN